MEGSPAIQSYNICTLISNIGGTKYDGITFPQITFLEIIRAINMKEWDREEEVYTLIDLGKFLCTQVNTSWEIRESSTSPFLHPQHARVMVG